MKVEDVINSTLIISCHFWRHYCVLGQDLAPTLRLLLNSEIYASKQTIRFYDD